MKKIVLTFGLISGAISAALMCATVPFIYKIGFEYGMYIGYSAMLVAFLLVFFGVRAYRENVTDGYISFWRALGVGLLISLISIICYVVTWEIVYFNFLPDFFDKYTAFLVEKERTSGAPAEQVAATLEQMKNMKAIYNNPLWNALFTFAEPLPVAVPVSLISAIILRRKPRSQTTEQQPAVV